MPDNLAGRGSAPQKEIAGHRGSVVKRPVVPVILALMLGLAAAAWGVRIPRFWLVVLLAGLLVAMLVLFLAIPSRSDKKNLPDDEETTIKLTPGNDDTS